MISHGLDTECFIIIWAFLSCHNLLWQSKCFTEVPHSFIALQGLLCSSRVGESNLPYCIVCLPKKKEGGGVEEVSMNKNLLRNKKFLFIDTSLQM